jgi:hypothetical protein
MFARSKTSVSTHQQVLRIISEFRIPWIQSQGRGLTRLKLAHELVPYRHLPVVAAFITDLKSGDLNAPVVCKQTAAAISKHNDGLIIGCFDVPYNPAMQLECLIYRNLGAPALIRKNHSWDAVAIEVIQSTAGFDNQRFVALFVEELSGVKAHMVADSKAFFFIDRFVDRFLTRTVPIVRDRLGQNSLSSVPKMIRNEVAQYAHAWTFLHEKAHRAGHMPIPEYLESKSKRSSAGLEELRADLVVITSAAEDGVSEATLPRFVEFVLAERLLRYGFDAPAHQDFDSRSSNILLRHLLQTEAASFKDSRLSLDSSKLTASLGQLLAAINELEEFAVFCSDAEQAVLINNFARSRLSFDQNGRVKDHDLFGH